MKPAPFDYAAPDTLEEVLSLLHQYGDEAKILAGGQSLIPVLNFRLARPAVLIDINRVPRLDHIEPGGDGDLTLGARVRQCKLEGHGEIARTTPLLHAAVPYIAHPQIRNRGTVGGSLAHADPAAELPAVAVALGASLRLASASGDRWVEAREFYKGLFQTELEPQEALIEVRFPPAPAGCGWAFDEVARRHGDYAQAGLAALITLDSEGLCTRARLTFFSVGETPMEASRAADTLLGTVPTAEAIAEAAEVAAGQEIDPSTDIHSSADFKRHLCRVLTRRVVKAAVDRARTVKPTEDDEP